MEDDSSSDSDESEREMADMGKAKSNSIIKQYRTVKNHFIAFLIHKNSKFVIDNMTNAYLTTKLIGEFATFMLEDLHIHAISTLLSYISDLKSFLRESPERAMSAPLPLSNSMHRIRD